MHGKSRRASERTEAHIRRVPYSHAQSVYPRRTLPAVLASSATLSALSRSRTHPHAPHSSQSARPTKPMPPIGTDAKTPPPRPPSAGMRIRNIDKKASLCYNTQRADKSALARRSHNTDGIWCNGNTRDFDSRFAGSSPAIPAMMTSQFRSERGKTRKREISRDFSRFFDPEFFRSFIDPFCPFRCCVRTRTHEKGFLRLPQSNRFCGELRICEGGGQRKKSCVRKNPGM